MLRINKVSKKYGNKNVVKEVSFDIPKGKVTSFIGPNGAGKSTVFNMIARLITKDCGDINLDDMDVTKWNSNELAKRLAILKQNNTMSIKLTIEELVAFGRFPYSQGRITKEDREKIDEAIAYMELDEIRNRYLDELSGGQRQRAFIAMVIAQDTEYILLDEPLNNLDIKHSIHMMQTIQKLCYERGKTIIVVMHDINFASCYSDYIIAYKDGEIVKAGKSKEVITEEVLEQIYEIPFRIQTIENRSICVYF